MDFRFNWKISLFCLVFLVIFTNLGLWQLDREEAKRELLTAREKLRNSPPRSAAELATIENWPGQPVRLNGEFDNEVILLQDNRVLEGQVGFEVIQLFHESSGMDFLVNRGFVPMKRTRDVQPDIPEITGERRITGLIREPGKPMMLGENGSGSRFPLIVQAIDLNKLKTMDIHVFPGIVRLDADQVGALPRYWPDVVMRPAQHRGYAFQWFAMAVAITIAWLFFQFWKKGFNMTTPEMKAPETAAVSQSRIKLLIIIAFAFVPIFIAYLAYFYLPQWAPEGSTNQGELILPPLAATEISDELDVDDRWVLILPVSEKCEAACQELLYLSRQIVSGLGKESSRVGRAVLVHEVSPELRTLLHDEHPDVRVVGGSDVPLRKVWSDPALFLMDPNGNIMMFFTPDKAGKPMLKDLKHLLRVSNIG